MSRGLLAVLLLVVAGAVAACATTPAPVKDAGQCVVVVVAGVDAGGADSGVVPNPGF